MASEPAYHKSTFTKALVSRRPFILEWGRMGQDQGDSGVRCPMVFPQTVSSVSPHVRASRDIIKIGNFPRIRIPKTIMEQCGFTNSVEMKIKDGSLVLSPHQVKERTTCPRRAFSYC